MRNYKYRSKPKIFRALRNPIFIIMFKRDATRPCPVHALPLCFLNIHLRIILHLQLVLLNCLFFLKFLYQNPLLISLMRHTSNRVFKKVSTYFTVNLCISLGASDYCVDMLCWMWESSEMHKCTARKKVSLSIIFIIYNKIFFIMVQQLLFAKASSLSRIYDYTQIHQTR